MSELELSFTRRFSMGHRLIAGSSERCAIPHGHNEFVTVTLQAREPARLDGAQNMVIPFADAKRRWHDFIDTRLDHAFQISSSDPLLSWFLTNEPARADRLVVTPGDPTTEMMAALLYAKLQAFLRADGDVLCCTSLSLEETPTNTVCLTGGPEFYLPVTEAPPESCWWNRADDTISDLLTQS
ncbi:6-pyruvoyl trahydropterin synthase family protein [Asaia bogorensis]|uniref:6-pyruvoyl trahydropterin synthase family protein n=1 Tax=Asaia bogorensis TaxID=91915 RepID=UPI002855BAA1|nr:6-carboxytetrahydropterin synthase [Asaia bogorensis]MDR6183784.1 6-pyruvoyltetrahydropterin/6-carboxytetrahydropterin synthase [Asaia bogorensis NBRC 16594]